MIMSALRPSMTWWARLPFTSDSQSQVAVFEKSPESPAR
jgi:hypothetical protein